MFLLMVKGMLDIIDLINNLIDFSTNVTKTHVNMVNLMTDTLFWLIVHFSEEFFSISNIIFQSLFYLLQQELITLQ